MVYMQLNKIHILHNRLHLRSKFLVYKFNQSVRPFSFLPLTTAKSDSFLGHSQTSTLEFLFAKVVNG